ncbi:class F sortase [Bacillus luteolus]|uniref:Class F sortase n=1 Tax=Litchfieldia luteola TaxID=682179 RepID=A0ABR9QFQ4_9BACI|nr:class F sortase [Cytobacillus luteolus]MBE4907325.1 class F sortase [Cytobacillus luteolus]MBP1943871.1 LPXTG-site transpeptidase (sortase) family protein [Cytobacillus luteolus]
MIYDEIQEGSVNKEPVVEGKSFQDQAISTRVIRQDTGFVPQNLAIPSLNLDANIISVGLQEDGTMEVPKDVMEVGWYTQGAKPGQNGNVVLAGHVDSYLGPGIFFHLENVTLNDKIIITDGHNREITYRITKIEKYPYQDGPLEEIFGFTSQKRLQLITCTGSYNPFKRTHEERLVVTAIEVEI